MKNTHILATLVIILLLTNISFSQQGWQQVTAPQAAYDLYGIYFADINTGLTDGFKTTNGGQNWFMPSNFGGGYAMMFPASNTGYISSIGVVFRTTNLGESWATQTLPTSNIMYSIYFVDVNKGYASGANSKIVKTTNGGTNWTLVNAGITSSFYLTGIYFVDLNTGFVAGHENSSHTSIIAKTTNGGTNWNIQNFPSGTIYTSISFINALTGIVLGEGAARTTDGGSTWVTKNNPGGLINSMYFSSANTGYAVGYGSTIIKTTSGGDSWFSLTSPAGSILNSVYFMNDNTGFICGNSGVVLKTTDGGGPPFGIQQISSEIPKSFSLSQNYPNPFNPSTKIRFLLPLSGGETEGVRLTVYDALGKEVATLVNTQLQSGTYETDWDASNNPSGVYFYRLTAGSYTETKRMALLK